MLRRVLLLPVVAMLLTALAGCATAADAAAWNAADAARASAAAAQVAEKANAHLKPWTTVIAAQVAALDASDRAVAQSGCTADRAATASCRAVYRDRYRAMERIRSTLGDSVDPSSSLFVGSAPDSISPLYTKTTEIASRAAALGRRWHAHCMRSDRTKCRAVAKHFDAATRHLGLQLAAWKPFLAPAS